MIKKSTQYIKITRNDNTSFIIRPRDILDIDNNLTAEFNEQTEVLVGIAPPSTARFILTKNPTDSELATFMGRSYAWRMTKAEFFYSDVGGSIFYKTGEGLLFVREETTNTVSFVVRGYLDLLNITRLETPLFRNRKTATYIPDGTTDIDKFTKLQAQNPFISTGQNVGVINALLWYTGGRPNKYKSLYTSQYSGVAGEYPKFYFDCDVSVVDPEWIWFNYENLYTDIGELCKASGGLLRQDTDGVVRFENIYNFNKTPSSIRLTDSSFSSLDMGETGTEPYSRIIATYTPRFLSGPQVVFSEVFGDNLPADSTLSRRIDFDKPVQKILNTTISGEILDTIVSTEFKQVKETVNATDLFGTRRTVDLRVLPHTTFYIPKYKATSPGNFTQVQDTSITSSQSTTIEIRNNLVDFSTLYIGEVKLYGKSLEASKQQRYIKTLTQTATISGFKELSIPDNPYVQSTSQMRRIVNITEYLMKNPRTNISVADVPFVSGLTLGTVVEVDSNFNNISGFFKVTDVEYASDLSRVNLSLLSVSGLYLQNSFFIVGQTYSGSDTKILSF